jgi:hypothetical protein
MNEAYAQWQQQEVPASYDQFVESLDEPHQAAVLLGNLNYQVENGGFVQWYRNGYSSQIERLSGYLDQLPTGKRVRQLLAQLECLVEDAKAEEDNAGGLEIDEVDWQSIRQQLRELDAQYHQIRSSYLKECEDWLTGSRFSIAYH